MNEDVDELRQRAAHALAALVSEPRPVRVEPGWSLFTTYTVNLLDVPTHQHGPNGPHYVSYKDATELLHRCIKAMQP